jgi:hypothetical protein
VTNLKAAWSDTTIEPKPFSTASTHLCHLARGDIASNQSVGTSESVLVVGLRWESLLPALIVPLRLSMI